MFDLRRSLLFAAALVLSMLTSSLLAQEDAPPTAGRGAQGGRGGRGGRGGGGRGNTREFLGLGPAPDEAAAKKGEPLYKQNCATCHGENARGAQAPNLVRSVVVLHDEKGEEIGPVIKNGRPQGGHAGIPESLARTTIQHLAVPQTAGRTGRQSRHLRRRPTERLRNQSRGDPKKGRGFFNGAAAATSAIRRTGDLAKIGAKFPQASATAIALLLAAPRRAGESDGHDCRPARKSRERSAR